MNTEIIQKLKKGLISNPNLAQNDKELKIYFDSINETNMLEINLLRYAILENIPNEIKIEKTKEEYNSFIDSIESNLINHRGIKPEYAKWAVNSWIIALDTYEIFIREFDLSKYSSFQNKSNSKKTFYKFSELKDFIQFLEENFGTYASKDFIQKIYLKLNKTGLTIVSDYLNKINEKDLLQRLNNEKEMNSYKNTKYFKFIKNNSKKIILAIIFIAIAIPSSNYIKNYISKKLEIRSYLENLGNDSEYKRNNAIQELSHIGNGITPDLISILNDPNANINSKISAISVLSNLNNDNEIVIANLKKIILDNSNIELKRKSLLTLKQWNIQDDSMIKILSSELKNKDIETRLIVLDYFIIIGFDKVQDIKNVLENIFGLLKEEDNRLTGKAFEAIEKCGLLAEGEKDNLLPYIKGNNLYLKVRAFNAFVKITSKNDDIIKIALSLLSDLDPEVKLAALKAIQTKDSELIFQNLNKILISIKNTNDDYKTTMSSIIHNLGIKCIPELIKLLNLPDKDIVLFAIKNLSDFKKESNSSVSKLALLSNSKDAEISNAALEAISNIDSVKYETIISSKNKSNAQENSYLKKGRVTAPGGLMLRMGQGINYSKIDLIPFGSYVEIISMDGAQFTFENKTGNWFKIRYGTNTGWAFSGFLEY